MQRINNPFPLFLDAFGNLMDGGSVYIGQANTDPETNPISVYRDQGLTQQLTQPLRTLGGYIVDGLNPCFAYVAEADYSIRTRDANGGQVIYVPSTAVTSVAYQPEDADLTAIAALATTSFGRNLLTLANQAALQAAVGLPAALPLTGGTLTGNLLRGGAGGFAYAASSAYPSVRIFFTAAGASDPTSQAGDIWIQGQ